VQVQMGANPFFAIEIARPDLDNQPQVQVYYDSEMSREDSMILADVMMRLSNDIRQINEEEDETEGTFTKTANADGVTAKAVTNG
jgi:hypothetical protein